jgi:hypothetical protein
MKLPRISQRKLFLIEKSFSTLYDVGECGKYAAVQTNNIKRGFEVFSEIENTFLFLVWNLQCATVHSITLHFQIEN